MLPEIKKQMGQVQQEFSKVDMKSITSKTQNAIKLVKQKIENLNKNSKDKVLEINIDNEKAEKQITQIEKEINNLEKKIMSRQLKLDITNSNLDKIRNDTNQKVIKEIPEAGNKRITQETYNRLDNNANYNLLVVQSDKLNSEIEKYNSLLTVAKEKYREIESEIQQTQAKQNIFTSMAGKVNNVLQIMKSKMGGVSSIFNKLPNITAKVNANIKQMSTGMKQGLGHILKYAGALFSLSGIYSILSNSASRWLSSQNAGAQQLKTNIEYMKNAMGSALAPVIQFITGLIYNLMKAIQSVVYALFRVNIFAKASAKSYASMAGSAKKAKNETKALAGIHDEINNVQKNDNADSGSGGGSSSPSFDLSQIETNSSIMDAIANGDWHQIGVLLGQKINEAMASIPWDKIQNTARQIGTNLANLLNGLVETVDWYQVGNTFAQGLNTVIYCAYNFITTFNWKQFGSAIANSINGFFDNVDWGALAQTLSAGLIGVFNTAIGFLTTLDWGIIIDSVIEFFTNVDYSGISNAFFEMLGSAVGSLVNLGVVIGDKINEAIDLAAEYFMPYVELCGGNIIEGVLLGIIDALIGIGNWVIEHIFQPFIEGFKNAFGIHSPSTVMAEMGQYIIQGLFDGITSLIDTITEIWNKMKETAITKFNEIKDKLVEIWNNIKIRGQEIWENIKSTVTEKINNLKTNLSNALNNIKTNWDNIMNGLKNTVTNIWNEIWGTIKNVINSILSGIEAMANGIVRGINKIIDTLNNLQVHIPDWVPMFGNKTLGFNINHMGEVSLPRLATGNVAYEETLAIFGEYSGASNNPEITTPRNIMADTFREVLSEFNGNAQSIELTVNVGNEKLGRLLLDDLRSMKRKTGKDIEAIIGG